MLYGHALQLDIYSSAEHDTHPLPKGKEDGQNQKAANSSGKEASEKNDDHHVILNHTKSAEEEEQRVKNLCVKNVEYDENIPLFALVFTTANKNSDSAKTHSILQNATYNRLDSIFKDHFRNSTQKYVHLTLNFSMSTPLTSRRSLKTPTKHRGQQQIIAADEIVAKVDGKAYFIGVSAPEVLDDSLVIEAFTDADSSMKMASDNFITQTVLVLNPKFDTHGQLLRPRGVSIWLIVVGLLLLKFIVVAVCVLICKKRRHTRRLRAEIKKRYSSNNVLDDDDFSFCDTDSDVETISMGEIEISPSLRSVDNFWRKKSINSTGAFGSEAFRKATENNLDMDTNTPVCRHTSANHAPLDDFSFAPTTSVSQLGLSMNFSQDEFFSSAYDDDSNSASTSTTNRELKARLEADQDRYSKISTSIRESIEEMESNIANLEKSIGGLAVEESIVEDDSVDSSQDTHNDDYSLSSTCVMTGA